MSAFSFKVLILAKSPEESLFTQMFEYLNQSWIGVRRDATCRENKACETWTHTHTLSHLSLQFICRASLNVYFALTVCLCLSPCVTLC